MSTVSSQKLSKYTALRRRVRVKVPSILQLEDTECGAACLAMVLSHFGRNVPLEELRVDCGVSRDGSNARNLVRAARNYGLTTNAFRQEPEQVKELSFPVIAHWRFYHFVVVEGYYPGGWYLNDPALGPRTCDDSEFDIAFTGVAIECTPGPDFVKAGGRPGVIRRILRAGGRLRSASILSLLVSLLLLLPIVLVPLIVQLYGESLATDVGLAVSVAVAGLLLAVCIQGILLVVQGSLSVRLATKISVRVGSSMVYRLLRLPAAFHAQRGAAVMTQRALLAEQLSLAVSALTVTASAGAITATLASIVLLVVDWQVGVVAVVMGLCTAWIVRLSLRRTRDAALRVVINTVEAGAIMSSSLHQIESIKASGFEAGLIARGLAAQYRLLEAQQRVVSNTLILKVLPGLLFSLSAVAVSIVAAIQVKSGQLTPGGFLAILALSAIIIAPITQVVVALEQSQTLRAVLDQVDDVLDTAEDIELRSMPPDDAPKVIRGDLRLNDVTFGYSPITSPVVSHISLHVEPGRRVALVGPSGCGKSTISRLVTGLYLPWSGSIEFDGRQRLEHDRRVLTNHVSLVDQDVTIFAGTIRDNVTLWDPSIPDTDVYHAIRDAQLEDDIARLPGGLDAILREGGEDLSGGQRQRLEIARALVRNPSVLVMDEATSALDPVTEQRIDEAIRRRGISCLVIAHRLSTIRDADEIVVLDKGQIVERGVHADLMRLNGAYEMLVSSA